MSPKKTSATTGREFRAKLVRPSLLGETLRPRLLTEVTAGASLGGETAKASCVFFSLGSLRSLCQRVRGCSEEAPAPATVARWRDAAAQVLARASQVKSVARWRERGSCSRAAVAATLRLQPLRSLARKAQQRLQNLSRPSPAASSCERCCACSARGRSVQRHAALPFE